MELKEHALRICQQPHCEHPARVIHLEEELFLCELHSNELIVERELGE